MDRSRNAIRSWLAILLAVAALVVPFAQPPHASAANGSLVIAALRVLEHDYVDPVQPVPLLNAAVATLRTVTHQTTEVLPDVPGRTPEATAAAEFVSEFSKAVHFVPVGMSESQLAYVATEGMLRSLKDSHTYYLDPQQLLESQRQLFEHPSFTGIGVEITAQRDSSGAQWIFVESVFPDSPASRAGVKRFDRIVSVNGHSLKNKTAIAASHLLRGPAGSVVTLGIDRGSQQVQQQLRVTRAPIRIVPVQARFIAPGVAYIKLFEFSRGAGQQLRRAIQTLQAQAPIHSAVLDLRANPGGLIIEAASVGGVFLPHGTVLARIHARGGPPSVLRTTGRPLLADTPLAVLVDAGSASASEILTAAFKDYGRAAIVGEKTAGALGGSIMVALPDGGMSVTVERIVTPKNARVEGVGITPDVTVALTPNAMERGQDTQLQAALQALGAVVHAGGRDGG
jgi:carboxyl-terminal processing protease